MPPAKSPANCGGPLPAPPPSPPSLLLLKREALGTGGANPAGGGLGAPPGTGGALGAALTVVVFVSIFGADLSFTCPTFLSLAPCSILLSKAP
jgi:hypothetical protein